MSQPKAGEHEAPHSLAPVQLPGSSDDLRDLERMRDGSGWRLLMMVALVTVISVGGVKLLDVMDTHEGYVNAVGQLERSDGEPRDAFMRCALPNYQRAQLTAADGLRQELTRTTERLQLGYARVLSGCMPLLMHFQEQVKNVRPPADVRARVDMVTKSTDQLVKAWGDLRMFLAHAGATYDQAQVSPYIDQIGAAWGRYQAARDGAHEALSARLQ